MLLRKCFYYRPGTWHQCPTFKYFMRETNTSITLPERKDRCLISTPIFYVNSVPHIGHLYTTVLADAFARWHKLHGRGVLFTTGTDEHGLKIQQAANKHGIEPKQFCDQISERFKLLFIAGNVDYSDYIRTTEERHLKSVHAFWKVLADKDYIYKGSYEGWYSTPDEAFLSDLDIEEITGKDGKSIKVSKESGHAVEWIKEDNYMFRLSTFSSQLIQWLDKKVIKPSHPYEARVREWIDAGLEDLSVSRQRERLSWGIPVPGDNTQTIYVWLDALTNYLTVCGYPTPGYNWNNAVHLVGKDILKFHAVYWPAFLMATDLQPPKAILCHAHWLKDYKKMSKSLGNVVDPFESIEKYSSDGLRYFLLREGVPHSDGNYSEERIVDCLNSEIVNTMGNLLSRCTGVKINPEQVTPPFCAKEFEQMADEDDKEMWESLDKLADKVDSHFENFEIYQGINDVMAQLRSTNVFVQKHKPWELVKDSGSKTRLNNVLHISLQTLRICGILLQPVTPDLCNKLLDRLNVPANQRAWHNASCDCNQSFSDLTLGSDSGVLMNRIKSV